MTSHTAVAPPERQDLRLMQEMFGEIAPRYDFITRMLSYGMDGRWKKMAVRQTALPENAKILDLAAGTGDFSRLVLQRMPEARAVAVDVTEGMLRLARAGGLPDAVCGDATALAFPDGTFDCVFIGYGLRNFPDLKKAMREIERVTKPGGLLVILDFFLPRNRVFREMYLSYLYLRGAFWGVLLHGRARTYTYITDSLRSFVSMDEFSAMLGPMGYKQLDARAFILGGIGVHWAVKR